MSDGNKRDAALRWAIASAGRPPDDADHLALLVRQCALPDTPITVYSCAGEEIGETWARYRVEMALVPLEAFYRVPPKALLSTLPFEGDAVYVIVRWRAWIIGAASWQEDWYDYDLSRWRQAVYTFPAQQPISEPLLFAHTLAQRAHPGVQRSWAPDARDEFLRVLRAALAQLAATGKGFNKQQVLDVMGVIDPRALVVKRTLENHCKHFQVDYYAEKRRAIEASHRR